MFATTKYTPFATLPKAKSGYNARAKRYSFRFNGQEGDDEIAGAGNIMSAEFWEYDTRLGRRWNIDPVVKVALSSYQCFSNSPIIRIDPKGDDDYYNFKGEYIGTIGDPNSGILRVVKSEEEFKEAQKNKTQIGKVIIIDERAIAMDASIVAANTEHNGKEYVMLIVFDPEKAIVTSEIFYEGSNYSREESWTPQKKSYDANPENKGKILIGTFHGHPYFSETSINLEGHKYKDVVSGISPKDYKAAEDNKMAIYAVDAFDKESVSCIDGLGGVHKAYPDGSFKNAISQLGNITNRKFTLGKDALETTGKKPSAQFKDKP